MYMRCERNRFKSLPQYHNFHEFLRANYQIFLFPDINECNEITHTCSDNATCINIAGFYECECFNGFIGNGFNCSGKHTVST